MKILRYKKATSTLELAKKMASKKETVYVLADEQSSGRGTKGRSFISEKGGIYLSYVKNYDSFAADKAFDIIRSVSVAVVKTLLAFSVPAKIKWPNDILVDGKKICGIFTENVIENGYVLKSLIGIGINVTNNISDEIKDIATKMSYYNPSVDINAVILTLINNLESPQDVGLYVRYSAVLGKTVTVLEGENSFVETIIEILDDGRLKTLSGRYYSSAEIKLCL